MGFIYLIPDVGDRSFSVVQADSILVVCLQRTVRLANPESWHSCGCYSDRYHLPKHCCRPSTPPSCCLKGTHTILGRWFLCSGWSVYKPSTSLCCAVHFLANPPWDHSQLHWEPKSGSPLPPPFLQIAAGGCNWITEEASSFGCGRSGKMDAMLPVGVFSWSLI